MPETIALKPIGTDTARDIAAAVAERRVIADAIAPVIAAGLRNVYFVGVGGSIICSYPAHYVLQQRGSVPVFQLQSDELNSSVPALMGPGSLVVVASWAGTTKETVRAAEKARRTGATVIAAAKANSPLAEAVTPSFAGKSDIFELLVAYAILEATGAVPDSRALTEMLDALPNAVLQSVEESEARLAEIADAFKDESITYVLGSGPCYGWAYGFAMCVLQETQWKHAVAFNTGEFFQGAFEVVDDDVAVLLWIGEDASRQMAERGRRFLDRYCGKARYVDLADLSLPGIAREFRGDVSGLVAGALANRLGQHYEAARSHDLDQRRYMSKVDY